MKRSARFFPTASISVYLVALAAVIAVPLIAFVIFLMLRLEAQQRDTLNADTQEDASTIARTIERELRDAATTLRLIATSPELETGDLAAFHARTQTSLRASNRYVLLVDRDGRQKLNTRVSYGQPLLPMANMDGLQSVLASRRIEVSNIFFGVTSQRWVFNVLMPLPAELASAGAALVLTQNAEDLQRLINTDSLPKGWSVAVLDQTGHVVTSTAAWAGERAPFAPETLALMTGMSGTIEDVGREPRQMYGYAQLPEWSWKVVVWGPIATAQATILTTSRYLIVGSLAILLVGLAVAYLVARQLRGPIQEIAAMAERIGRGEIVSPVETRITEANQVAVALSNASFDRSEAEDRVHLIMHELVHRTKNIMTLVQAMMRQLARRGTSMEAFQQAIGERLQGLGKSIEMLAQEQWAGVPIARVVAMHLETFVETRNRVDVRGPDFVLRAEAVQNLGLVLHELATNSVKYGALSVPEGRVDLGWSAVAGSEGEEEALLTIRWEERGGPPVSQPVATGFGTTIIRRHAAASFSAQVEVEYASEGFRWQLTGPRRLFERQATETGKEGHQR
ncbi:cache domain-containing protein [Rhizobium sp. CSW-27]|uniref:HWE histidine kinase domain-containing protein n=1 Tax=Rhizobium sp. CSW-27 TaxID=2839985 RepID=UPI001C01A570|nr:cache domain-containing protein [Rhizobium sp. CSW-27]MBT9369098.1 histidine kinase [Rhizobium sp. CSW-27]